MDRYLTMVLPIYNEAPALQQVLPQLIAQCEERKWELVAVSVGVARWLQQGSGLGKWFIVALLCYEGHVIMECFHHRPWSDDSMALFMGPLSGTDKSVLRSSLV